MPVQLSEAVILKLVTGFFGNSFGELKYSEMNEIYTFSLDGKKLFNLQITTNFNNFSLSIEALDVDLETLVTTAQSFDRKYKPEDIYIY